MTSGSAAIATGTARSDIAVDISTMLERPESLTRPWWPVARSEVVAVNRALVGRLAQVARDAMAAGDDAGELLAIVLPHYAFDEVISLYHAYALTRRARLEGSTVLVPQSSRLFRALARNKAPDSPTALRALRKGPPRPSSLRAPARYLRRLFVQDGMRYRPPALTDWDRDVVLTIRSSLAHRHARSIRVTPVYGRRSTWFGPISPAAEAQARGGLAEHSVTDAVTAAVAAAFAAGGEDIPAYLTDYCRRLFVDMATLTACHLRGALLAPARLPRKLWTGSGSPLWDRILRTAVRHIGGEVTGHDHGFGAGHRADNNKAVSDFYACNRFVTFSAAQAEALQRNLDYGMMLQPSMPELVAIAAPDAPPESPVGRPRGRSEARPRVMYVASGFDGERTRSFPKLPPPVAIDWQRRLFARFAQWGWEVVYKYHPELSPSEDALRSLLGVEVLGGRLEHVGQHADLLVLDWPNSTAFGAAMLTDRPVLYVDLGNARLDSTAEQLLRRRCGFVTGRYDQDNRVAVDWVELRDALDEALALSDRTFPERFLLGRNAACAGVAGTQA